MIQQLVNSRSSVHHFTLGAGQQPFPTHVHHFRAHFVALLLSQYKLVHTLWIAGSASREASGRLGTPAVLICKGCRVVGYQQQGCEDG